MEERVTSIRGVPLEHLQLLFKIDPDSPSGLSWLPRDKKGNAQKDSKCGAVSIRKNCEYKSWNVGVIVNKKTLTMKCSRIILLLSNGYLTIGKMVDHIDGNSLNNNLENLREVTSCQNCHNRKIAKNNTSGNKGVYWYKQINKWNVRINLKGKNYSFGYYENLEEAIKVAIAARAKLHGEFGRNE
jgi:5-methylcytosine-specific restriction endonuclease McrA